MTRELIRRSQERVSGDEGGRERQETGSANATLRQRAGVWSQRGVE
jgi:hypothetical protein